MKFHFFKTPADFRDWLEENHETVPELIVGFYKKGTGKPSITWPESVEQALCFGWIDGVRRTINEEAYSIRFTPRRAASIWSAVNIKKMEELLAAGMVKPMGHAAYEKRKEEKSRIYSFERETPAEFTKEQEKMFKTNKAAWKFFNDQPPYYKKVMKHLVTSAKQEKTQLARLQKLISSSEKGQRIR